MLSSKPATAQCGTEQKNPELSHIPSPRPGRIQAQPEGERKAFDHVLLMADGTGIGVQFSSGDEGDEYTVVGMNVTNYPASSPYATAVGGTTLQVGKHGERLGEFGWATGRSVLCTALLEAIEYPGCNAKRLESWVPPAPGEYDYGGGGGTDYDYPEPAYQEAVVPAALAERNSASSELRSGLSHESDSEASSCRRWTAGSAP